MKSIIVTGGAGYLGSHTTLALCQSGFHPVIIDNFSNSNAKSIERVRQLAGGAKVTLMEGNVQDLELLESAFERFAIDAVIHFAGSKAVGESVKDPLTYYTNNLCSTLTLMNEMKKRSCFKLVFSSSATVYGEATRLPIRENQQLSATNPYGRSKLFIEKILRDLATSDPRWKIALLRYFNPVGAHPSGMLGESQDGPPNNLFPCITQFAVGLRPSLKVFGNDYPTSDGSGVRDYLHVCDLAEAHVAALSSIDNLAGAVPINLGTGAGYSVIEVIRMFEEVSGKEIPFEQVKRRAGDIAECYADPSLAKELLNWTASKSLSEMCEDAWRWQSLNPKGFA
jgi:UDP-glucose 4-epimerase